MKRLLHGALFALLLAQGAAASAPPPAAASTAPTPAPATPGAFRIAPADDAWRAALPRDAMAATQAYLDRLPADVRERSNAYYEGDYWLQLWSLLLGLGIAALMLAGRRSARVRDWCAEVTGQRAVLRDGLYGAVYAAVAWLLSLPLTIYAGFVREHAYAMATQTFGAWFGEQLLSLGIEVVLMAVAVAVLYAIFRRAGARWWVWGAAGCMGLLTLLLLLAPAVIDPLFNTFKPVAEGPVKASVLRMAHANGVPADNIFEFDASRQTTRISANVTGIFGTAAIRLNDNLLRRTSPAEINAVMAHELGHFVLNHNYKRLISFSLLLVLTFWFARWLMEKLLRRLSGATGVGRVDDVATLPMLAAVVSLFVALTTPISNTLTRVAEIEADRFSLSLSREPHGFAEAQLRLVEYRKADPGPIEEFVFFHHPSTRHRIHDAMRWREAMGTTP
jgi:STE24 endopeptidase